MKANRFNNTNTYTVPVINLHRRHIAMFIVYILDTLLMATPTMRSPICWVQRVGVTYNSFGAQSQSSLAQFLGVGTVQAAVAANLNPFFPLSLCVFYHCREGRNKTQEKNNLLSCLKELPAQHYTSNVAGCHFNREDITQQQDPNLLIFSYLLNLESYEVSIKNSVCLKCVYCRGRVQVLKENK